MSLFGKERGEQLSQLEPQDVFVNTINGMKFEVFGISLTIRRQADFKKWTTLLQVISSSQVLIEAFLQKYSFEKLLGEIMTAIDLNKAKIQADQNASPAGGQPGQPQQPGQPMGQPGGAPGAMPNMQSQQPGVQNAQNALAGVFGGAGATMPATGNAR